MFIHMCWFCNANKTRLLLHVLLSVDVIIMEDEKYKDYLIVPDVIDQPPNETCDVCATERGIFVTKTGLCNLLQVVFKSGAKAILGNELRPEDVREAPKVHWTAEKDGFYSLLVADADTQNPDKNEGVSQWQQWVVVNIPGKDISKGQVLSEYIGSGPLPGTGLHRYVVLVFKQSDRLKPQEPYFGENDGERKGFSVRDFAHKYDLNKPVAGNFYQAKYDDSVRQLYNEKNAAAAADK